MINKTLRKGFISAIIFTAMTIQVHANELFTDNQANNNQTTHLEALASNGNAQAQLHLALIYHRGAGVAQNEGVAVEWYHRSAENGNKRAQEFLAIAYKEGWFGLTANNKRANYWNKQLEEL